MKRLFILLAGVLTSFYLQAQKNSLDYFVNYAISNSPLLKDYNNQVLSFRLDSQLLRATMKLQVNGISTNSYAPVINGWGYDPVITNLQQVSAMVQVSKSFLSNKTIGSQIAGLQVQSQGIANAIKISEQDVIKSITDQYITTYGEQLQLDYNYEVNGLLKKEDSLLKILTQNNVYRQTDYLSFAVTVQQQLLATSQLEVQYNFDYAALNYLAGIMDTASTRL